MDTWQQKIHDNLMTELMHILDSGDMIITPNSLAKVHAAKLSLICPKCLDPSLGYGAGLEAVYEDIEDAELTHAVISTPFKAPIPFIEEFFRSKKIMTWTLTGGQGIDADEQDRRIAEWTARGGVMIQTIKYAQSYELVKAKNMYMLGYSDDPEENEQAEDRIHRLTSGADEPVNIWYVRNVGTYEQDQIDRLITKKTNQRILLNTPEQLKALFSGSPVLEALGMVDSAS
jgi:hypothetical protein